MADPRQEIRDELLVLECLQGDTEAFRALVARWQEPLWRHAYRLTGQTRYLEIGRTVLRQLIADQDRSDDPHRRGSIAQSPMYVSLLFFGVPCFLEALQEAGLGE